MGQNVVMVAKHAQRPGGVLVVLRLLTALALTLAVAVLLPTTAHACSCASATPDETFDRADVVFTGVIGDVSKERGDERPQTRMIMDVGQVFKGDVYAEQTVLTPFEGGASANCGLGARPGSSWVIFGNYATSADAEEASVTTNVCLGSEQLSQARNDLGPARPPLDGSSAAVGRAGRIDDMVSSGMKVAGISVLGLLAVAGIALAVVWRPGSPRH